MTDTAEVLKEYTRKDVHFHGEYAMEGPHTTANRYQLGDAFYLIIRNRLNAPQNEVLRAAGLGYGNSYDEHTQMSIVQVANQHTERPWISVCAPIVTEDEEEGIRRMLDWASANRAVGVLEEAAGAVDITDTPVLAEALKAMEEVNEVDVDKDPVVTDLDEPGEPTPTVEPDLDLEGNEDEGQPE